MVVRTIHRLEGCVVNQQALDVVRAQGDGVLRGWSMSTLVELQE